MEGYQARVIDERKLLSSKINRLIQFIDAPLTAFDDLSNEEKELLLMQLDVMERYLDILDKRIELFGV